jgi:hypothetical protein
LYNKIHPKCTDSSASVATVRDKKSSSSSTWEEKYRKEKAAVEGCLGKRADFTFENSRTVELIATVVGTTTSSTQAPIHSKPKRLLLCKLYTPI